MTGRTEHLERELKLSLGPDLELPALNDVTKAVPLLPSQQLRATYYDTSDFRLFDRNITFRNRVGDESEDGIWTLKLPGKAGGRTLNRREISWPGSEMTMPEEAQRILCGIVRLAELKPVVRITTTRCRFALRDAHGVTWAELDDDTAAVHGGPQDGLRFRQLELELSSETDDRTTRAMFREVVHRLQDAGASPESDSKLAKALGPAVTASPLSGGEPQLGPQATVADVVRASITSSLDRILTHDVLLRVEPTEPEPEDVHQARVATRRLRSDLKTFATVLDPVWAGHVRDDLRWAGAVLGKVRDVDVLEHRLELVSSDSTGEDDAGRSQLRGRLMEQRRQAVVDLAAALGEERYLRLLDRLHAASSRPPIVDQQSGEDGPGPGSTDLARRSMPGLVARSWHPLDKKARKATRHHPTDGDLHQIRIKAKQVRYASELAASVTGKLPRRTAGLAKKLQSVLGDHHDAVTAEAWLAAEARRSTPEASYSAGLLAAEQRRLQKTGRRRWKAVWHNLETSAGWLRHS